MSKKLPNIARATAFALISVFGLLSVSASAQLVQPETVLQFAQATNDCLSRREAQEATVGGQLIPMQQIYASNGLFRESVVDRKVCRNNGELYYVLSIFQDGMANTIWINARTGQG